MVERQINIRVATEDDMDLIIQLIKELAIYEKLGDAVVTSKEAIRAALFSDNPSGEVLIGELGGEPVGFALFFHNYSTFLGKKGLYLEDLFVKPTARGHGIGKLLLTRLAQIAVERDCARMEWSVLDWNAPSIAFYKSLGALPMDEWTVFRLTTDKIRALAEQTQPALSDK
ncbi:MAG: GNAT family N-acetyltransferase [Alphaproteobacteria bacterium]